MNNEAFKSRISLLAIVILCPAVLLMMIELLEMFVDSEMWVFYWTLSVGFTIFTLAYFYFTYALIKEVIKNSLYSWRHRHEK